MFLIIEYYEEKELFREFYQQLKMEENNMQEIQNQSQDRNNNRGDDLESKYGGECVCPNCGFKIPHEKGTLCYNKVCQKCGIMMTNMK